MINDDHHEHFDYQHQQQNCDNHRRKVVYGNKDFAVIADLQGPHNHNGHHDNHGHQGHHGITSERSAGEKLFPATRIAVSLPNLNGTHPWPYRD